VSCVRWARWRSTPECFSGVRVASSLGSEVGLGLRNDQKIAAALEL